MIYRSCIFTCFVLAVWQGQGWAASGKASVTEATSNCVVQTPRFPVSYANFAGLRNLSKGNHEHSVQLIPKGRAGEPADGLSVWVQLREIDIDGDGQCDLIVTVLNQVSTGGDSEALTTLYLARGGKWKRIGAFTGADETRSTEVDIVSAPNNENYQFSEAVVTRYGKTPIIVAWNSTRIVNSFDGYRLFQVDETSLRLLPIDRRWGVGAAVWHWFTARKPGPGVAGYDPKLDALSTDSDCAAITEVCTPSRK